MDSPFSHRDNSNELIREPQMELKVNCVPVCSGMCSELDSQKVDNAVKLKRERSLRRVSEILIAISPRGKKSHRLS